MSERRTVSYVGQRVVQVGLGVAVVSSMALAAGQTKVGWALVTSLAVAGVSVVFHAASVFLRSVGLMSAVELLLAVALSVPLVALADSKAGVPWVLAGVVSGTIAR